MAHLEKHRQTLLLLSKAKPKAAKQILKDAPNSLIQAIAEIALNSLNGVIPLTAHKIKKLKRHKNNLRALANASTLASRRKTLQKGGWVGSLLSLALPLLFKGASKLVSTIKARRAKAKRRKLARR